MGSISNQMYLYKGEAARVLRWHTEKTGKRKRQWDNRSRGWGNVATSQRMCAATSTGRE